MSCSCAAQSVLAATAAGVSHRHLVLPTRRHSTERMHDGGKQRSAAGGGVTGDLVDMNYLHVRYSLGRADRQTPNSSETINCYAFTQSLSLLCNSAVTGILGFQYDSNFTLRSGH